MPPPPKQKGPGRGGPSTINECEGWKWAIRGELANTRAEMIKKCQSLPDLYCANSYFSFYKTNGSNTHSELDFGVDKIQAGLEFDEHAPKDSQHPKYRRFKNGLQSYRPVCSNQVYGWYRSIDQPKYGNERASLTAIVDRSHISRSLPRGSPA